MTTYIFFKKLEADINRYMAEVTVGEEFKKYRNAAENAYIEAIRLYKMLSDHRCSNEKDDTNGDKKEI